MNAITLTDYVVLIAINLAFTSVLIWHNIRTERAIRRHRDDVRRSVNEALASNEHLLASLSRNTSALVSVGIAPGHSHTIGKA